MVRYDAFEQARAYLRVARMRSASGIPCRGVDLVSPEGSFSQEDNKCPLQSLRVYSPP